MANAYSVIRPVQDYIPPQDLNFLNQAMAFKQQRFDANAARIQGEIDAFKNLDVMKAEDKEYINNRLTALVEEVNSYAAGDLSSDNVTRNISHHIRQTLDPKAINAITSTNRAKSLLDTINEVKTKNPQFYAPQNEEFALRGLNSWLDDGQAGTEYTGGSYVNYHDYNKELESAMKNVDKFANVTKKTYPNGQGYFVTEENRILSEAEVRSIAKQSLSQQSRNQLQIDGWMAFGKDDLQTTKSLFEDYTNNIIRRNDQEIARQSLIYGKTGSKTDKEILDSMVESNDDFKNNIGTLLRGNNSTPMQYMMQEDRILDGVSQRFSFYNTTQTFSSDPTALAMIKMQHEKELALLKANKAGQSLGRGLIPTETPTVGRAFNKFDDLSDRVDNSERDYVASINNWLGTLDETHKKQLELGYKKPSSAQNGVGDQWDYERLYTDIQQGRIKISPLHKGDIVASHNRFDSLSEEYGTAISDAISDVEAGMANRLLDIALKNPQITVMYQGREQRLSDVIENIDPTVEPDDTGFAAGLNTVLGVFRFKVPTPLGLMGKASQVDVAERQGDFRDKVSRLLEENPEVRKSMLSAFYAAGIQDNEFGAEGKQIARNRLIELNDGNEELADQEIARISSHLNEWMLTPVGPPIAGSVRLDYDVSFEDDGTSDAFMESFYDNVQTAANQRLNTVADSPRTFNFRADVGSREAKELFKLSGSTQLGVNLNPKAAITIDVDPNSRTFTLSQIKSSTIKGEPVNTLITSNPIPVEGSLIEDQIDLDSQRNYLDAFTTKDSLDMGVLDFAREGTKEFHALDQVTKDIASVEGVKEFLANSNPTIYQSPQVRELVDQMLTNDRIRLSYEPDRETGSWNYNLSYDHDNTMAPLDYNSILDVNGNPVRFLGDVQQQAFYFPHLYLTSYLNKILGQAEIGDPQNLNKLLQLYNIQ